MHERMSSTHDVAALLETLKNWGAAHNARVGAFDEPPASDADLAEVESTVGRRLPDDLRRALQTYDGGPALGDYGLIGAARIKKRYEQQRALVGQPSSSDSESCQRVKWSNGWIPFAEDGGPNFLCLDFDPGPRGAPGQVIWWDRGLKKAGASRWNSFGDWLAAVVDDCTAGRATVEADGCVLLSPAVRG
jgi:cell wall assembly regulator SMI1